MTDINPKYIHTGSSLYELIPVCIYFGSLNLGVETDLPLDQAA